MYLTLDIGMECNHEMITIPAIQLITEDCKVNDVFCGRQGRYSLNMNGLCHDCDIKPCDGYNICIDQELIFNFIKKSDVIEKTEEPMKKYYLLPIRNCFHDLSFDGCSRNIYRGTPAENLHAILLGCVSIYQKD